LGLEGIAIPGVGANDVVARAVLAGCLPREPAPGLFGPADLDILAIAGEMAIVPIQVGLANRQVVHVGWLSCRLFGIRKSHTHDTQATVEVAADFLVDARRLHSLAARLAAQLARASQHNRISLAVAVFVLGALGLVIE